MLTLSTQIPTHARGLVRATVKAHPAWKAFLTEKDMISADAKNHDLIELALRHPSLKAQVEQILWPQGPQRTALEELQSSTKVKNLVLQIEYLLRQVGKPRIRVRALTVQV